MEMTFFLAMWSKIVGFLDRFQKRFALSSKEEASSAEEQLASNSLMQDDNRGSLL
jgi:hypothetical protein